ncbi:MAG TPA: protein translocase subunit SecD, partial [Isosphaeraceae bacterium]
MNKFAGKFTLIGITTLLGLLFFWPPSTKLKTGIDLSGGTILVYEIKKDGQPANFDIDELITSLKRRINPEGVLDIPIRKLGGDRIEIILPKASAEEVEEVKEKMTKVVALEFRILANRKHDAGVIDRAMGKNGLTDLPKKYMWARLGETVTGKNPVVSEDKKTITDPTQHLERNAYAGQPIALTGKTSSGTDQSVTATVASNTATSITLTKPITLASVASYTIDYNPSEIRGPQPGAPPRPMDEIVRDEQVSPGRTVRYILCDVDRQDVTGGDLARVYPTQDDRLQPAVGFTFNRPGARRFGTLTREHLPEEEGAFKYRLAILLDSIVRSAPTINSQIKDQGIIEFGSGGNPKEVARLIEILNAGKLPATLNPEPLQEENIGPTLGEDTIAKGITAIIISMLVVPIFMIVYYRF